MSQVIQSSSTQTGSGGQAKPNIRMRVLRQDKPSGEEGSNQRWEEFDIEWRPGMNIIYSLMAMQRNQVTAEGQATDAVVWESNCLEEVCGACTMLINGKVRQACSALVDKLAQPISVEPLTSFPIV